MGSIEEIVKKNSTATNKDPNKDSKKKKTLKSKTHFFVIFLEKKTFLNGAETP